MFKLVVLTALLAAVAAEPGLAYYGSPLAYSGGYYPYSSYYNYNAPLATTYAAPLAPAVAPLAPVTHFIKKRSASPSPQFIAPATSYVSSASYVAPTSYSYLAPGYVAPSAALATGYSYPYYSAGPYAHLIKKRSVAVAPLATSYIAPASYASTYSAFGAAPIYNNAYVSPYYAAGAFPYSSPFFIKK